MTRRNAYSQISKRENSKLQNDEEMEMLIRFPGLIPQNADQTEYDGFIQILDEEFRLNISIPEKGKLQNAEINCDWRLQQLIKKYKKILQQRLAQCGSLVSFLSELSSIVERQLELQRQWKIHATSQNCGQLIEEMEVLGWDRLVSIDASFQTLQLMYSDSSNRQHVIKIKLHPQHPKHAPVCTVDLPGKFDIHWTASSSLVDLYNHFTQVVSNYQDFWNVMDELDKNCWILEPENPMYGATYRRIAVSTNASLQITVNPVHPHMLPECRFMGAEQAVNPLRQSMNTNLHLWNDEEGLLTNLQLLLSVTFPSPSNSSKQEFSVECGICYSYRLESEIPDEACNDPRCGQPFHQSCLYEWLRALPSSRQSFNTIFGECPYCSKQITVKMAIKRQ